jgi:prophage DNA circulation protein
MTFEPLQANVRQPAPDEGVPTVFEQYEVASFRPDGGQKIAFPVKSIRESGGNRLVERERPYRDGAKVDDTGSKARRWDMSTSFFNSIEEPGLEANGEVLYPNVLNLLLEEIMVVHATGDLVVPTRGSVRARAESYDRLETADERDGATVTLVFIEDNEDNVDARSLGMPTVNATAIRLANVTQFSAEQVGAWHSSFQDLVHFAAQLEGLANAPREYVREMHDKARMAQAAHNRVVNAFKSNTVAGRGIFLDPAGNRTERNLVKLMDRIGRSLNMPRGGKPGTVAVVFEHDQSIASIAAMLGLDYEDLLYDNPQLPNPGHVPKGTPVNIPENAQVSRHG